MAEHRYRIVIEPLEEEDGGGWLATVPDLPGCMSDGETPGEALKHVQDAIASWLDEARALRFRKQGATLPPNAAVDGR